MSPRTWLGDTRHWVGLTNYLIGNQRGPSYKATSKGVMGDQEEYSREKQRWRRIIFDRKNLMKRIHHHKDVSSVGIWMDLVREETKGTSKVVIVSFLYFIPWVSGLCNHFNIVSGVQLDRREPLDFYLHLYCLWNHKCKSIESKKTGTSGASWEEHRIYPELDLGRRCRYNSGRLWRGQQAGKAWLGAHLDCIIPIRFGIGGVDKRATECGESMSD